MARMFPRTIQFRQSPAEVKLFALLGRALPDDYSVLHHVPWLQKKPGRRSPDGEADFLVAHPRRGALVIEVKGGRVTYHAESGKWFSRSRDGTNNKISDPFKQAKDAAYSLLRYLLDREGWPSRWGPVGYAVCFPDARFALDPLPQMEPAIVIDHSQTETEEKLRARIEEIFDWWQNDTQVPDERGFNVLLDALAHDVDIHQPLSFEVEDVDREIVRLSERQFGVLTVLSGNRRVAVAGPAGSGKTLLASEKATKLANEGHHVLLTCFNRPLALHLQRALKHIEGLDVLSFFQLCGRLTREAGVKIEGDPSEPSLWDELSDLLGAAADLLGPQYDAIIVDEGQDFEESWWIPLLMLLRDPDFGIFYVFYDDNQSLYHRPHGLPDGLVSARLWENWRNARPVFDQVMQYYTGDEVGCAGPEGPPVETVAVAQGSAARELSRVLHRLIVEETIDPQDIVVLTPRSIDRSEITGTVGAFTVCEEPKGTRDVKIASVYRFKGLDSKVVILCELDAATQQELKNLMYVGCSRARSLLVLMSHAQV